MEGYACSEASHLLLRHADHSPYLLIFFSPQGQAKDLFPALPTWLIMG